MSTKMEGGGTGSAEATLKKGQGEKKEGEMKAPPRFHVVGLQSCLCPGVGPLQLKGIQLNTQFFDQKLGIYSL